MEEGKVYPCPVTEIADVATSFIQSGSFLGYKYINGCLFDT